MPFYSIIIPTYNRAERLKITINSVLSQTFQDFELLIMDDGSTDNTKLVVRSFKDSRITYLWAKNSGGPATPRNKGLHLAKGEWISFLDADDVLYPNRLAVIFKSIKNFPKTDVFCHNEFLYHLSTQKKSPLHYGPYSANFYEKLLKKGNCLSTSAISIKKTFLFKNNLEFNIRKDHVIVEDYDLWLNLARKNAEFRFIKSFLGDYIIEEDNISLDSKKNRKNLLAMLKKHVYELQSFEKNKDKLWEYISIRIVIKEIIENFNNQMYSNAFIKMTIAIFKNPILSLNILSKILFFRFKKHT